MTEHRIRLTDKDLAVIEVALLNRHRSGPLPEDYIERLLLRFQQMRRSNRTGRPSSTDSPFEWMRDEDGNIETDYLHNKIINYGKYEEELDEELEGILRYSMIDD